MTKKLVYEKLKVYFLEHWEVYNHYLWLYWLNYKYDLNLSIKEKDLCQVAFRLYSAWQKKKNRIKKMLDYIIMKCRKSGNVWFCTFTFEDQYLQTPHKEVVKVFKDLDWCILNEDWGKTTNRRHYHAIIGGLDENELDLLWDWGFTKFKRVSFHLESYDKVSKYIVKLSQHAIKKQVARNLYYSKKVRFLNR